MSKSTPSRSSAAPVSSREAQRLEALRALALLDTPAEPAFDDLATLAAETCATPAALITLIDESRQWFKSAIGLSIRETPRTNAFCIHALAHPEILVVPDATLDPRFADNPFVTGEPHLRFYAGAPLVTPDGHTLGTLCVIDLAPRQLDERQLRTLRVLSHQVMSELLLRRHLAERERTVQALRHSEQEQQELVRRLEAQHARLVEAQALAQVGSWETDLVTLAVTWSLETHRIFGTDAATFQPTHAAFLQLVHPEDRAAVDQAFTDSIAQPDPQFIEHRLLLPAGLVKFIEERWQVHRDAAGRPVRALGTCQNITERKRAQEERDRLFNFSLDLLCIAGFDGRLQQVSPAWEKCLGWTPAELTGRPMLEFIHPDDHSATRQTREKNFLGEPVRDFQNRYRCRDGSYRWLSWNVHPLPESRLVFGVARDVTVSRENERRLRLLDASVAHLNDVVVITEAEPIDEPGPHIVYVNDAFERLTGYTRAEALGRSPRFLQGPKTQRAALDQIRAALQRQQPVRVEVINYAKSGQEYWIELEIVPVADATGHATHAIAIGRDITGRKAAEAENRALAERLVETLENITDAFFTLDEEWRFTFLNREAERLLSLRREALVGQTLWAVFPEVLGTVFEREYRRARAEQTAGTIEAYYAPFQKWYLVRCCPSGSGLAVYFRDITATRQAAETLRASDERFRLLAKATHDAIWDWDLATNALWWNEGYETLFGYRRTDADPTTKSWVDLIHPDDLLRVTDSIRQVIARGGNSWTNDYRFRRADGTYAFVFDRGHIIRDAAGQAVRMIGGMMDLTERKRAEEDIRRANETLAGIVVALQEIGSTDVSLPEVLTLMAKQAQALTGASGGMVETLEGDDLVYRAGSGSSMETLGMRMPVRGSLSGLAVQTRTALISDDTETDERVNRAAARRAGARSMIVAPLRDGTRVVGVLKVMSAHPQAFTPRDVSNLQILAESLGSVIQRRHATEQLRASEAQYRLLFASNPHPMWAYDLKSLRVLAVNAAAVRHYGYTEAEFLAMTILDFRPPEEAGALERRLHSLTHGQKTIGRWRHRKKDGTIIDVEVSSDRVALDGRPARLVLANDITERVQAEREAARADRALRMLSRCNEALIRAESENDLLSAACRIAVEIGGARMAWVGYAQDDEAKTIHPQAHAGMDQGYFATLQVSWAEDSAFGRGPSGRAIRSGRPVIVPDFARWDEKFPWLESAQSRGYHGMVCLPLKDQARAFGVLAIYWGEVREVVADELRLLQELADNLAFGILNLRARLERRKTHEAVLAMARGISARSDAQFFVTLARSLVDSLGAQAGFIARLNPAQPGTLFTLSAIAAGEVVPNFSYTLEGTPCADLARFEVWLVARDAGKLFPAPDRFAGLALEACAAATLTDATGRPIGLIYVQFAEPITQQDFISSTLKIFSARAAAELERLDTDAKTREQAALLDKAQDAILVRDLRHRISYWSKGAERLYGWTAAEVAGRSVREFLYFDPGVFDQAMAQLLVRGDWMGELSQLRRDGSSVTIEGRWTLMRDAEGRPQSVLAINTDITERKKLEQQFLRAQRMESIGTLAGGIAHDLNNLLAPITMGVGLLKQLSPAPGTIRIIDTMERSAKRGSDLVKQVLSFARGVEGARVPLNIGHLIREVESIVQNTFPKNIEIVAEVPRELWLVSGDPTQLNQVIVNLSVNARDAMPDGGRLGISTANVQIDEQYAVMNRGVTPGRYVVVEVSDNGCGIPQPIIDRIFEPFFTTKEVGKGTGLGLSTVSGIVRSHGGFVNVYSEPGKGSTFRVHLPAHADPAAAEAQRDTPGSLPRGRGELILVVDDEVSIVQILKHTLEAFGYRVLTAEDGAQAISVYALHSAEIALVLTDMMMPVMDGPALVAALHHINPTVRIIAASGLNAGSDVARATQGGVQHFIAKPYSTETLLALLRKVLGGSALSQEPFPP